MNHIFLDSNSTTFVSDEVLEAMNRCLKLKLANPSSQHELGRRARRVIESSRDHVSSLLGLADDDQCLFTSGGTESNNLAIFGRFPKENWHQNLNIVSSSIEHPSVLSVLEVLADRGVEVRLVDPEPDGRVRFSEIQEQIDERTRLVCCMYGNNETGVIQPVEQIASVCQDRGVDFHVDAVQAIGKTAFDFKKSGFSSVALSAHKLHGPSGCGALLIRGTKPLFPVMFGGYQQNGIRPGTESVSNIVGLEKSIELACDKLEENDGVLRSLRNELEKQLVQRLDDIFINGAQSDRLPHTTNISFEGIDRQQFVLAADMSNLAVSTGSACSSGSSQPSHVLTAMKCPKSIINSAIRFGVSLDNTLAEITEAVSRICKICDNIRPAK